PGRVAAPHPRWVGTNFPSFRQSTRSGRRANFMRGSGGESRRKPARDKSGEPLNQRDSATGRYLWRMRRAIHTREVPGSIPGAPITQSAGKSAILEGEMRRTSAAKGLCKAFGTVGYRLSTRSHPGATDEVTWR